MEQFLKFPRANQPQNVDNKEAWEDLVSLKSKVVTYSILKREIPRRRKQDGLLYSDLLQEGPNINHAEETRRKEGTQNRNFCLKHAGSQIFRRYVLHLAHTDIILVFSEHSRFSCKIVKWWDCGDQQVNSKKINKVRQSYSAVSACVLLLWRSNNVSTLKPIKATNQLCITQGGVCVCVCVHGMWVACACVCALTVESLQERPVCLSW